MKYLVELVEVDGETERQISFSFEAQDDLSAGQLCDLALNLYDEGEALEEYWSSAPGGSFAVETRVQSLWKGRENLLG